MKLARGIWYLLLPVVWIVSLTAAVAQNNQDYRIGAQDILKITVYEEPDLTNTVRVTSDGMITFPLIGNIKVAGLTVTDLEQKLTELLARDYLVNPQIYVFIEGYHSKKVFVLGAVNRPGAYELSGNATILELISRAEGITKEGSNSLLLVRTRVDPKTLAETNEPLVINLNKLLVEGDVSQNIKVEDKDIIHIPRMDSVFVFGEVKNPGSFKLEEKNITVMQAVTMAGGLTRIAAPKRTKIIRVGAGEEKTILVDLNGIMEGDKNKDVLLQAQDMIIVPESFF